MKRKYQICTRCIMDTTDPDIVFDENGICNHCKRAEKLFDREPYCLDVEDKKIKFNGLIAGIKSKGKDRKYDCVMGLSGGVDSSYAAYLAKINGLRPLGISVDNGWDSQAASKNVKNICKKLKIDLYSYVLDWEEFKDLQLSFLKASTPDSEVPSDNAIFGALFRVAAKERIQFILLGYNLATESILPSAWSQGHFDLKYIKSVQQQFGSKKLRTFPALGAFRRIYYKFIKRIKLISFLDYFDYNKEDAKKFLQKELDWKDYGAKHHESIYTKFFQAYILPIKFGFDKRKSHLSSLICTGQITREQALEELKKERYPHPQLEEDMDYVVKKLGITKEEFDNIMALPCKSYPDYPNYQDSWCYRLFAKYYYGLREVINT